MKWPARSCQITIVLLVLLALGDASAAPAAPGARRKSLAGRTMAYHADLHVSYSSQDGRASAHDDAKRTYTRELATRNSEASPGIDAKKLRIAVPHKHGFQAFVNITHPNTTKQKVTGYSIEVFKAALEKLNNPPEYEFCAFDGTYDELVLNVSNKDYDAAVGDVTITAERVTKAAFTMPYTQSGLSLLVLSDNDSKSVQWIFLEPLTKELWMATVGGFLFTGFVVWMIEHPRNPEYQGSRLRQLSNAWYFAFSTLTFSHEPIIRSSLSKIVLVVWCFAVLVLVQSYTANLSSMLTAKRLRPLVTDLNQLVQNGDRIGYQEKTFTLSFLQKQGVPEKQLQSLGDQTEYADALRKGSKNGGVSAIVDEIPYLTYFLLDPKYNKEFEMVNRIYRTPGLGFVFPLGSPLVQNLSIAILDLTQGNEVSEIEDRWLGRAALSTGDDSPVADSAPLTLRSFSGLFVITGCISTLMLLIRIARSVYARYYSEIRDSGLQNSDAEDGSANLGESNVELQDDMGYGSAPDQGHHEDRREHSVPARGSCMCIGNAGPCQIHNGSVPADFVRIEMSSTGQAVDLVT
ncbi:hypothetical protein PR202_gb17652 [Eleusine coracana subsp. coracana]|uniref:Ionotropic glutamate receptor C-terminal domain-containing protein n=1 Tax=Eleusine coracana subsp. coracana TaxID=191504 RepID=A0AAV5F3L6_ELECO|nr:hypothetical protein PR202_gb17652 [Eleusine coracana subsp. coracana]